jgi:hypothetical protein
MATDAHRLLELLREAGEEAVTLDELAIAGVRDPARALRELEEAGHRVQRLRDQRFACVRLAPEAPQSPAVPAVPKPPERTPRPAAGPSRALAGAIAAVIVLAVLAAALRRRRG